MAGAAAHETDYAADPLWRLVAQQLPPGYARYAVTDPDGVLADAVVTAGLAARGLRLLAEADPIALRAALLAAEPATSERPLALTTPNSLATLPYDFWQQARHVDLALHRLFPNLDYVTLQRLTPPERRRLAAALTSTPVPAPVGTRHTQSYLLTCVCRQSQPACLARRRGPPGCCRRRALPAPGACLGAGRRGRR
jgi:hypothetical protein